MLSKESFHLISKLLKIATILRIIPFDWNPNRSIIKLSPPTNRKRLVISCIITGIDIFLTIAYILATIHYVVANENSISGTVPLFLFCICYTLAMIYSISSYVYNYEVLRLVNKFFQMNQLLRKSHHKQRSLLLLLIIVQIKPINKVLL